MRKYRTETSFVVNSVRCDRCGREDSDPLEIQEYLPIDFTGGYNSVFGDSEVYTADFCQTCVKNLLGGYLRNITEEYMDT